MTPHRPRAGAAGNSPEASGSHPPVVIPAIVFVTLFAIYALTICPTVGPGDSGELTAVMTSWGVAHAPGYPLLSLIGNVVSLLPFPGEPALLLNLMTALFAALAAALMAAAILEVSWPFGAVPSPGIPSLLAPEALAALVAGLFLGTSRVFWEYALVVEVFALNSLFGALLIWLLARFLRGLRENRPVVWPVPAAALVATTAITHHLTLVLVAIPALLTLAAAFLSARRVLPGTELRRALILAVLAGALGLLPLLYIPIAAHGDPVLNWDDPKTTGNLIRLLKREDFGSGTLMNPWVVANEVMKAGPSASPLGGRHVRLFFEELLRSFGWIFLAFPLLGVAWSLTRRWWALFLLLFLTMLAVFFLRVNSPVLPLYMGVTERFYILPGVVVAFLGGLGLAWLARLPAQKNERYGPVVPAVLALALLPTIVANGHDVSMRGNTFTRDFGANFLEGIPGGAIVLSEGDLYHNAFYYQQASLRKRTDLELVDQQKLTYPWYVNQLRRRGHFRLPEGMTGYSADTRTHTKHWLDLNLKEDGRKVVAVGVRDQSWFEDYRLLPMGLWWTVARKDRLPALSEQAQQFKAVAGGWRLESLARHYHDRSWEAATRPIYARAMGLLAGVTDLAEDLSSGRADIDPDPAARAWLEKAAAIPGADRKSVLAAHLEVYHRALAEKTLDLSALGGIEPLFRKAQELARRAVAEDSSNVAALKTLAALSSVDPGRNPYEELRIRGRLLDQDPSDVAELGGFVQLGIDLMNDPARRRPEIRPELIRRERDYLSRLELAIAISDDPSFKSLRDQWRDYLKRTESLASN